MKSFKKVLSSLLLVLMIGGLFSGCSSSAKTSSQSGSNSGNQSTAKKKVTIGWAMAYFDHPVYQKLMDGAKEIANQLGDVDLIFADGKNDPTVQASQIDNFIAQKVDAIILTAAVADPMLPSIKKINDAHIPLIIVDRRILKQGQAVDWACYVTWDMVLSGKQGAEQTIEALNGKGKVVVVEGTAGAGSTIDRGGAYYSKLKESPDIQVVYKVDGDFNRTKGMEVTETILKRYPNKGDFDAIYYMNDEMTLGGLQAIKAAGRLGEFKIISVDGEKEAIDAVKAGEINYEVMFKPDEQAVAVNIARDIAQGKKPDYSNVSYKGQKIEVTKTDDGFTWVRPTCYKVDKKNCNDPAYAGW